MPRNLAPAFLNTILRRYEGTRLARQELNAEVLEDLEGALWSRDVIERNRIAAGTEPDMRRIVVAVDPATSCGEDSDETGIVVCGLGIDGRGYILEDCSGRFSPTEWATRAVAAYKRHRADRVIIEKNQGGDMAENTLRMIDKNVPVRAVVASRGKIVRAEPVSALYEQNRVSHVGAFDLLEDQLCTFEAGSAHSPDRLDALVYGLSDLLIGFEAPMSWHAPIVGPSRGVLRGRVRSGHFGRQVERRPGRGFGVWRLQLGATWRMANGRRASRRCSIWMEYFWQPQANKLTVRRPRAAGGAGRWQA